MKSKIFKILNILFLLCGLVFVYFLGENIGWKEIWEKIQSIKVWQVIVLLLLPLSWYILHSLGWFLLLEKKRTFNFWSFLGAHISAASISEIIPMGQASGEPYRILYIKKRYESEKSPNIIASIILYNTIHSIVTGFLIALGFSLILLFINVNLYKRIGMIIALLIGFGMVFYFIQKQKKGLLTKIFSILEKFRLFRSYVERKKHKAILVDERLKNFYTQSRFFFFLAFFIILIAKLLGAIEFYLIMLFINYPISLEIATIVFAGSAFIQLVLFFFPGQIGVTEGGIAYLFKALGYDPAAGLVLAIFRRIRTLFWTVIGLIIAFIYGPRLKTTHYEEKKLL